MAQAPGPWYRIVRKGRPAGPVAHRKSPDTSTPRAPHVESAGLTPFACVQVDPPECELHGPLPPCRVAPSEAVTTSRGTRGEPQQHRCTRARLRPGTHRRRSRRWAAEGVPRVRVYEHERGAARRVVHQGATEAGDPPEAKPKVGGRRSPASAQARAGSLGGAPGGEGREGRRASRRREVAARSRVTQ